LRVQWLLQILILSVGIYMFLRFVQTTRGSRLLRGLVVSFLFVVVGLWGLSRALELEELTHIIQSVTGFFVILLVVLFQPELRRGIAQLGEGSLLGQFISRISKDSINEIVQAVQAMASRRHGALIAIECESSLDAYIEGGVKVDSAVNRLLLESIFHPGASLHDGAVVVRKDRVAASACLFPLTENIQIARSTGTRHRAALGLSDETDAVTVVVSEETGQISVARHGQLQTVPSGRLEPVLREVLGPQGRAEESDTRKLTDYPKRAVTFLIRERTWLAVSLLLATGTFYAAHQEIRDTRAHSIRIVSRTSPPGDDAEPGALYIVLPSEQYRVVDFQPVRNFYELDIRGTRAQLDQLVAPVGVLEIPDPEEGVTEVDLDEVRWRGETPGIQFEWADSPPTMEVLRFDRRRIELHAGHIAIDDSQRNPYYEVFRDALAFEPPGIEIEGPATDLAELDETLPLLLETIHLTQTDTRSYSAPVALAPELIERHFRITGTHPVVSLPLRPATRILGGLDPEISLICMNVEDKELLESTWTIPPHSGRARFEVHVSGLIPAEAEPGSAVVTQRSEEIMRFVRENLVVWADLGELPPEGQGRAVPVRWMLREDWRSALEFLRLDGQPLGEREELIVRLKSDAEILLEERAGN